MSRIGKILRSYAKLRFKVLGHATIKDIPTDQFNQIIETLASSGWKKKFLYDGFDAWIDYGKVELKGENCKLTFEWDNWTEGSIQGPIKDIEIIAAKYNFKITNEWRWAEYDEKPE